MLFPEVSQDFELPAPGTYTATLIEFLDLGTQEGEYGPKRNVRLSWEIIGNLMRNGKPFVVSRLFNFSMAEKSSLRPFVEAMMGRKFSSKDKELDTQNLLGKACLIEISHKETGEKTYANVTGCLPLPAGTPIPTAPLSNLVHFALDPKEFDEETFNGLAEWKQKQIGKSPEWMNLVSIKVLKGMKPSEIINDAVPF